MITKEMITQRGNKIKITVDKGQIKLYNNGSLAIKSSERPWKICGNVNPELAEKGVHASLDNKYINKETYELIMATWNEEMRQNAEALVSIRIAGWETINATIDTRENIEEEIKRTANYYNIDIKLVKDAYLEAVKENQVKEQKEVELTIKKAKATIAKAEQQQTIMTDAEYQIWARNYNNLYNEGEKDGYIPQLVTKQELKAAKEIVKRYS